jgi:hypothetical protein
MTLIGRLGVIEERENPKTGKPYLMYKIATTDKGRPQQEGGESRTSITYQVRTKADNQKVLMLAEEYKQPPTSWHTIFAHGAAIERLQMIEKG